MSRKLSNPKKCYACEQELTRDNLAYNIKTLKTYCVAYELCFSPDHPNSPQNVAQRGSEIRLIPVVHKDLVLKSFSGMYTRNIMLGMEKVLGSTVTTRPTPPQALHIAKVAQENNLKSVNATLSYIIEEHMKQNSLDDTTLKQINWTINKKSQFFEKKPDPKPDPVPEIPKEEEKTEPNKPRFTL